MKHFIFLTLPFLLIGCQSDTTPISEPITQTQTPSETKTTSLLEGTYILDTNSSIIEWSCGKIVGSPVVGTVQAQSGTLSVAQNWMGSFVLDMTSIYTEKDDLVAHLKNEDFFDVEKYPTTTFQVTEVHQTNNTYQVTGDLTILNETHPITFQTTTIPQPNGNILMSAQFPINRTLWGVTYGSGSFFDNMGDKAIQDEILFQLHLVFTPESLQS